MYDFGAARAGEVAEEANDHVERVVDPEELLQVALQRLNDRESVLLLVLQHFVTFSKLLEQVFSRQGFKTALALLTSLGLACLGIPIDKLTGPIEDTVSLDYLLHGHLLNV